MTDLNVFVNVDIFLRHLQGDSIKETMNFQQGGLLNFEDYDLHGSVLVKMLLTKAKIKLNTIKAYQALLFLSCNLSYGPKAFYFTTVIPHYLFTELPFLFE